MEFDMSELITPSSKSIADLNAQYWPDRDFDAEQEASARLRRETLADIAALFSAFLDLHSISLTGGTPSFNDGDPCYHGQNDPHLNGRDEWSYREDDEDDDEETEDEDEESPSARLSKEDFASIAHVLAGMADELEEIFTTNWKLIFRRTEDGSVEFTHEEYDCGY